MADHKQILIDLGGPHEVVRDLADLGIDVKPVTVRAWKTRNKIPVEHWGSIIQIGKTKKTKITTDMLAGL